MTEKVCENCRYWYRTSNNHGECRRNPPDEYGWPGTVSADAWCGEYQHPLGTFYGRRRVEGNPGEAA
jgi:hypothetical protein